MTSGSTSFSSLYGIESNIYVVSLVDLTSLYNSSSPMAAAWLQFDLLIVLILEVK